MVAVSVIRAFVALNLGLAVAATYIPRAAPGSQFITGACKSDADCASSCCGFKSGKCAGAVIAQQRDGGCGHGDAEPNNKAAQAIQGANAILPGGKGNGVANGDGKKGGKAAKGKAAKGKAAKGKAAKGKAAKGKAAKGKAAKGKAAKGKAATGGKAANGKAAKGAAAPKGKGKQFITGACKSDADCASGCCGFKTGKCAGAIIAQERDGGCGFGDGKSNDRAAKALQARGLADLV